MRSTRPPLLCAALGLVLAASAGAGDAPEPDLGIGLLGSTDGVVEVGEPLRITVRLTVVRPDFGPAETVTLAPAGGTWVEAIEVQLVDALGEATGVLARPAAPPDEPATTLAIDRIAGGLWRVAAGATRGLAPGSYRLRARLRIDRATPDSGGWTGETVSEGILLELVPPSTAPERAGSRAVALAHDALLEDRVEQAATILDELLVQQPGYLRAWIVRAVVCERAGNLPGALQSLDRAQALYAALEPAEPHAELGAIRSRVLSALLRASDVGEAAARAVPEWSWPPAELLDEPASVE